MISAFRDAAETRERRWDASIDLELERQNGRNWCWAAVAKGIVEHYGGPKRKQCQYATTFLRRKKTCCRSGPLRLPCDQPHDVDSVLMHYGMYAAPPFHRPVGLQTLYRELERDRPVVALMRYPTTVHAVLITAVDVANGFLRSSDPDPSNGVREVEIESFVKGYDGARWFYTILTRPVSALRSKVSLLHDRMRQSDEELAAVRLPLGETLEVDLYELDPYRLADGTGLQTPEYNQRASITFGATRYDGWGGLQDELTKTRDEIEVRIARGFEVRIVRCHAYKLEALWFTDPTDPSHRSDHYLPFGNLYDLEDKEYSPAELRDAMIKIAPIGLAAVEHSRKWIERLDRETAHQDDDES